MSENKNNISAVRLGDKLIIFLNGQRQVISKSMSPEIFDTVVNYIERNEVDKISNIFDNFEDKLSKYLKEYFELEEGKLKDNFHNVPNHFSKLLIRKATQLMKDNLKPKPLFELSKKILFTSDLGQEKSNNFFNNLTFVGLTEKGNLLLPLSVNYNNNRESLFGNPISLKKNDKGKLVRDKTNRTLSLVLQNKENTNQSSFYALISPFDIMGFQKNEINVTRYKVYSKGEFDNVNIKGVINIPKENLFEIPYKIFEKKFKNN